MLAPVSATGRAMQIGMTSKDHSLIEMSMTAYWTIRARLLQVPGVANVALWNERLQHDAGAGRAPAMQPHNVSLDQVMEATADAVDSGLLRFSTGSVIGTGGLVDTPNQRLTVRNVLPIVTPADLAQVAGCTGTGGPRRAHRSGSATCATSQGGPPAAHRRRDHQRQPRACCWSSRSCPGRTPCEMTRGVEDAIDALRPGLPGVHFDTTIFQQANFIELAIHNLTQALVLGFILVVVILGLFLFEWRVALISLLTIPLSLMATMLVLHWMGQTVNTMILAGLVIALGAVVDDAIIDVENIVRRLRQHRRAGGSRRGTGVGDPGGLAGGPEPDRLRDADHRGRSDPGVPAAGPDRGVLPAAGAVLHAGDRRLDGRRDDAHSGADAACCCGTRPIERRESPLVRVLQRGYTALLAEGRPAAPLDLRRRPRRSPCSAWR